MKRLPQTTRGARMLARYVPLIERKSFVRLRVLPLDRLSTARRERLLTNFYLGSSA